MVRGFGKLSTMLLTVLTIAIVPTTAKNIELEDVFTLPYTIMCRSTYEDVVIFDAESGIIDNPEEKLMEDVERLRGKLGGDVKIYPSMEMNNSSIKYKISVVN